MIKYLSTQYGSNRTQDLTWYYYRPPLLKALVLLKLAGVNNNLTGAGVMSITLL